VRRCDDYLGQMTPSRAEKGHSLSRPSLLRADDAAARGRLRAAIRHAFAAANIALQVGDEAGLKDAGMFAASIRDRTSGRARRQADVLARYCAAAVEDLRSGERSGSLLDKIRTGGREEPTKRCPDCAEKVKAAARVCRFCGHRFELPLGGV
jgi:uncharacterized protein UPF0547